MTSPVAAHQPFIEFSKNVSQEHPYRYGLFLIGIILFVGSVIAGQSLLKDHYNWGCALIVFGYTIGLSVMIVGAVQSGMSLIPFTTNKSCLRVDNQHEIEQLKSYAPSLGGSRFALKKHQEQLPWFSSERNAIEAGLRAQAEHLDSQEQQNGSMQLYATVKCGENSLKLVGSTHLGLQKPPSFLNPHLLKMLDDSSVIYFDFSDKTWIGKCSQQWLLFNHVNSEKKYILESKSAIEKLTQSLHDYEYTQAYEIRDVLQFGNHDALVAMVKADPPEIRKIRDSLAHHLHLWVSDILAKHQKAVFIINATLLPRLMELINEGAVA